MRILIAEDSPVDSLILGNILSRGGHDPVVARSGEEALEVLEDRPEIGLVLADIHMPGMSGIDLVAAMRSNSGLRDVRVIFVSGASEAETVHRAAALRPDGYILKPFNEPSMVLSRVDGVASSTPGVISSEDVIGDRTGLDAAGVKALLARVSEEFTGAVDPAAHPGAETAEALEGLARRVGAERLLLALAEGTPESWAAEGRIHRELRAVLNCVSQGAA